eukprot:CAMPEP_0170626936 /NCGR_PEP_ID=MMETSP0224-20130122/31648_1 /TAXON_ID=285029 /ORGANISM="Togula jolla, Strain CCCM 725" /LENGTH=74 /DNA_ID=CAMNT_0010953791 /DNA_START=328 /DNA_END=552 /DNA_ORIENTATION=-
MSSFASSTPSPPSPPSPTSPPSPASPHKDSAALYQLSLCTGEVAQLPLAVLIEMAGVAVAASSEFLWELDIETP